MGKRRMKTADKSSVIVVGGGIGGLAAALALAHKGIAVRLFEQAPEFKEIGAGIQLGPNVFRMFECLGVTDEINKFAVFPESLLMRDSVTGQEVTRISLGKEFLAKFNYPYAVIHRADLHRVLLAANQQERLIELRPATKIETVEEGSNDIIVRTDTGERHSADALIGADGLWSTIRPLIVNDGKPVVSGHIAYRAVLPTSEMPEHLRWQSMALWGATRSTSFTIPCAAAVCSIWSPCFTATSTRKAGTLSALPRSCTSGLPAPAPRSGPCWERSRAGACGCCATGSR